MSGKVISNENQSMRSQIGLNSLHRLTWNERLEVNRVDLSSNQEARVFSAATEAEGGLDPQLIVRIV